MKFLFLFGFLFLNFSLVYSQIHQLSTPGKCYAKSYTNIKYIYDLVENDFPVFTGASDEDVELKTVTIYSKPAMTLWEKCPDSAKKYSKNPSTWCLVEHSEETYNIQVVVDTSTTKNYSIETFQSYENLEIDTPESSSVWTEVVCKGQLKERLIFEIQDALKEEGFYPQKENIDFVNREIKDALIEFQKSKNLPFGQIDKTTLEALNITFP